jgi:hypothetical protein
MLPEIGLRPRKVDRELAAESPDPALSQAPVFKNMLAERMLLASPKPTAATTISFVPLPPSTSRIQTIFLPGVPYLCSFKFRFHLFFS